MGDNSTYVDQMLIEENAVVYVTTRSGKRLDKSPSVSNHEAIERENLLHVTAIFFMTGSS
jgi:hypothetical protein